jgi:hypothetical protein
MVVKKKSKPRADAVAAFWGWWPTVQKEIAASFGAGGVSAPMVRAIGKHVSAIDSRLDWEFGPGKKSRHHMCVSAKGDPELRVVAERWLHHAPKPNKVWEFYASRQPHRASGLVIRMDDKEVALDEILLLATPDDSRERIDIVVHHPIFAKTKNKDTNLQLAFIALDNLLGEDDVERFVGSLELAATRPKGKLVTYAQFGKLVAKFAAKATGDKWALLEGNTADGARIVATTNTALKRIDHPLLDMHVTITIALQTPNEQGLPTNEEGGKLNAMEDALLEALGDGAVNLGHESTDGRRVVHLHVMEGGPAAQQIERWRMKNKSHRIEVVAERDPQWHALERFG